MSSESQRVVCSNAEEYEIYTSMSEEESEDDSEDVCEETTSDMQTSRAGEIHLPSLGSVVNMPECIVNTQLLSPSGREAARAMQQLMCVEEIMPALVERVHMHWYQELAAAKATLVAHVRQTTGQGDTSFCQLQRAANRLAVLRVWEELRVEDRETIAVAINVMYLAYLRAQQPAVSFDLCSHSSGVVRWDYKQQDVFACLLHLTALFRDTDQHDRMMKVWQRSASGGTVTTTSESDDPPMQLLHAQEEWARDNMDTLKVLSDLVSDLRLKGV